jgi:hypothetical protein
VNTSIEKIHTWYCGWPPGWNLATDAKKVLVERGYPTGAKRRWALAEHYASDDRLVDRGFRGLKQTCFRALVTQVLFALKFSERDQWACLGPNPQAEAYEEFLEFLEMAFTAGYAPAAMHAYRFCMKMNIAEPHWLREWHVKFMEEKTRFVPLKRKVGRPKGPSPQKWMEDLQTFVLVNFWRNQLRGVQRAGTPRWISFDEAILIVRAMSFRETVFGPEDDRHIETIKRAYKRTVDRFSTIGLTD